MSLAEELGLEELAFLVGHWTIDGQSFPAVYGAAGRFGGDVVTTWGPRKSWIRLEQTSNMGPLGPYSVVVLVYLESGLGRLRCFSVDSNGSGRIYDGQVTSPGEVMFTSEPSPADGTIQRVTYAEVEAGRVRFVVELSSDEGRTFHGFSEAVWSPRVEA